MLIPLRVSSCSSLSVRGLPPLSRGFPRGGSVLEPATSPVRLAPLKSLTARRALIPLSVQASSKEASPSLKAATAASDPWVTSFARSGSRVLRRGPTGIAGRCIRRGPPPVPAGLHCSASVLNEAMRTRLRCPGVGLQSPAKPLPLSALVIDRSFPAASQRQVLEDFANLHVDVDAPVLRRAPSSDPGEQTPNSARQYAKTPQGRQDVANQHCQPQRRENEESDNARRREESVVGAARRGLSRDHNPRLPGRTGRMLWDPVEP